MYLKGFTISTTNYDDKLRLEIACLLMVTLFHQSRRIEECYSMTHTFHLREWLLWLSNVVER